MDHHNQSSGDEHSGSRSDEPRKGNLDQAAQKPADGEFVLDLDESYFQALEGDETFVLEFDTEEAMPAADEPVVAQPEVEAGAQERAPSLEQPEEETFVITDAGGEEGILPDLSEWAEIPEESQEEVVAGTGAPQSGADEMVELVADTGPETLADTPLTSGQELLEEMGAPAAAARGEEPAAGEIETAFYGMADAPHDLAGAPSGPSEAADLEGAGQLLDADWFSADSAQELASSPSHEDAGLAAEWSDDLDGLDTAEMDALDVDAEVAAFEAASTVSASEHFARQAEMAREQGFEDGGWDEEMPELDTTHDVRLRDPAHRYGEDALGELDTEGGETWEDDLAALRAGMETTGTGGGGARWWRPLLAAGILLGACWGGWHYLAPLAQQKQAGTQVATAPRPTPAPDTPATDPGSDPAPVVSSDPTSDPGTAATSDPGTGEPAPVEPAPVTTPPVEVEPAPQATSQPASAPNADPGVVIDPGSTAAMTDPVQPAVTVSPASWQQGGAAQVTKESESTTYQTRDGKTVQLLPGETIVELPNGHYFKGRMKRIHRGRLTLADGRAEYTFDLADIAILETGDPEYRKLEEMPTASVRLANGQRLRGHLVKETPEHVVLAYETGRLMVPRRDVVSVSFSGRVHF